MNNLPKVTIRQREGATGNVMTGASTEVLINGKRYPITKLSFDVESKSIAKLKLEMLANVEIEGKVLTEAVLKEEGVEVVENGKEA